MSEQPRSALEEAAWLVDTLRRKMNGGGGAKSGDVWSEATRASGPDIVENLVGAGGSLIAAAREAMAGFERTRPPSGPDRRSGSPDDPVDIG